MTALDPPDVHVPRSPTRAGTAQPAGHVSVPSSAVTEVLGRSYETGLIAAMLDDARVGGSSLVLLGSVGAGVTTLLHAAGELGERSGFVVLRATARRSESGIPRAGLSRITEIARQLASAAQPQVGDSPRAVADAATERRADGEQLRTVLGRIASARPVLVTVDDAHLLDPASVAALAELMRWPAPSRVALLLGGRAGRLVFDAAADVVLGPLDDRVAARIVQECGVPLTDAVRRRILADAAGNPLALHELPLAWRAIPDVGADLRERLSPLTDRHRRSIGRELADLPPETSVALLVAALNLDGDAVEVIRAAESLAGAELTTEALSAAVTAGLISVSEGRAHIADPLLRAAVVRSAPPELLRDAALALAAASRASPMRSVVFTAMTLVEPDADVAALLEASAADALRREDPVEALRRLESAARLSPMPGEQVDRLLHAARIAFELGRPEFGEAVLEQAERLELSPAQAGLADTVRVRFTARLTWQGVPIADRCRLVSSLATSGRVHEALEVVVGVAQSLAWADPDTISRAQVLASLDDLPGASTDPRFVAALAIAAPARARALMTALAPDQRDPDACRLVAVAALSTGDIAHAADLLSAAATVLRRSGRLGLLAQVQGLHAHVTIALGDWNVSSVAADESLVLARATDQQLWELRALSSRAAVSALRGELSAARADAAEVERAAAGRPLGSVLASVHLARALAFVCEEQWVDAYDTLRRLFDPHDPAFNRAATFRVLSYLAEVAVRCGRTEDARRVVDELEALAGAGIAVLGVNLGYARALLADDDRAEQLFLLARAETPGAWPWMRARIDLAYGSWLRRHRRAAESRAALQAARHTLELMGAAAWSAHARRELRAAGVDLGGDGPVDLTGVLSPQEEQIARLAAQGLSNREIGQRLFLSPRTVGSHLYRIFPKLDVTSRAQLASRLSMP